MIDRRGFLGLAGLGLASSGRGLAGASAQDPKPGAKGKSRKAVASSKGEGSPAPSGPDVQVVRILEQARTDGRRLPGMVGGIIRGEELTNVGSVGLRKIGSPEPFRVDDVVHLGSCTKALTATMIGTLVDEGKLRWNSKVLDAFPDWSEGIHPDYRSVTLGQLLSHRAGLPHDFPWWQAGPGLSVVDQRRALLARGLQAPPASKPGSTYAYSNAGYVLAGMMAEQAARLPWEDLMIRRVFGPLKMTTAGFGPPGSRGSVDHAWGHRASGDLVEAVYHDNPPAMGPAGTIHCTLRDWARFGSFHLRGALGGVRLLKPDTFQALHTPQAGEEYAGGWIVLERSWAGGLALNHAGSNTYWYCVIWLAPARDFGVLVATNAAGKPVEEASEQAVKGLIRLATFNDRDRRR